MQIACTCACIYAQIPSILPIKLWIYKFMIHIDKPESQRQGRFLATFQIQVSSLGNQSELVGLRNTEWNILTCNWWNFSGKLKELIAKDDHRTYLSFFIITPYLLVAPFPTFDTDYRALSPTIKSQTCKCVKATLPTTVIQMICRVPMRACSIQAKLSMVYVLSK